MKKTFAILYIVAVMLYSILLSSVTLPAYKPAAAVNAAASKAYGPRIRAAKTDRAVTVKFYYVAIRILERDRNYWENAANGNN